MQVQGQKGESKQVAEYKNSTWKLTEALRFREAGQEMELCLV